MVDLRYISTITSCCARLCSGCVCLFIALLGSCYDLCLELLWIYEELSRLLSPGCFAILLFWFERLCLVTILWKTFIIIQSSLIPLLTDTPRALLLLGLALLLGLLPVTELLLLLLYLPLHLQGHMILFFFILPVLLIPHILIAKLINFLISHAFPVKSLLELQRQDVPLQI